MQVKSGHPILSARNGPGSDMPLMFTQYTPTAGVGETDPAGVRTSPGVHSAIVHGSPSAMSQPASLPPPRPASAPGTAASDEPPDSAAGWRSIHWKQTIHVATRPMAFELVPVRDGWWETMSSPPRNKETCLPGTPSGPRRRVLRQELWRPQITRVHIIS